MSDFPKAKFPCGENPLITAVQDAKNALKLKMAAIKVPGVDVSGALAEIKAAKAKLLADLKAAVPEIPKLPDFQKELNELKSAIANKTDGWADKLSTFESQWGGTIDDLQDTLDTLGDIAQNPKAAFAKLDICKQKDVELENGKAVEKPLIAQDSTEPAKKEAVPAAVVKADEVEIKEEDNVSGSDITEIVAKAADAEIRKAIEVVKKTLEDKFKSATKEYREITKRAYLSKVKRGLPKTFFESYPGASVYEYYLVNGETPPDKVNKACLLYNTKTHLSEILKSVEATEQMVKSFFSEGAEDYSNMSFFDEPIAKHYYMYHGYGLSEGTSNYGTKFRALFKTKLAKTRILPAFKLSPENYTASKAPINYSLTDYSNAEGGTIADENYKTIVQDVLKAMFEAKLSNGRNALSCSSAYAQGKLFKDVEATLPDYKEFLVKPLGGNRPMYEVQTFADVNDEQREELALYSSSSFEPHYMYKAGSTVFVNTYPDHVRLSKLGYMHSQS